MAVPIKGLEVSAKTKTQNTLAFENFKVSRSLKLSISKGTSCTFSIFGERALFEASVSWYLVTENYGWRDNFKRECVKLGENPSNPDTIVFF